MPRSRALYEIASTLRKTSKRLQMQYAKNKARLQAAIDFAESEELFKASGNERTLHFINCQLKMQIKKSRGRRYTMDDNIFALSLMTYSPTAYKLLRRTFALPSRRTLMALLAHLPMHCGINKNLIRSLGESVQKIDPIDKHCVLLFDEISLEPSLCYSKKRDCIDGLKHRGEIKEKKFADHAMVFMARGIRKKWKQPVAFY
ncbi:Transposase protein [Popillia japonica]|uniref:Transposase protein n=1 Tax=Popillia japonica TaxID=7064 RepID=A0AAW1JIJ0_POPJA